MGQNVATRPWQSSHSLCTRRCREGFAAPSPTAGIFPHSYNACHTGSFSSSTLYTVLCHRHPCLNTSFPSSGAANRAQQCCSLTRAVFVRLWPGCRTVTAPLAHACVLPWQPSRYIWGGWRGRGEGNKHRASIKSPGKPTVELTADLVALGERKWLF